MPFDADARALWLAVLLPLMVQGLEALFANLALSAPSPISIRIGTAERSTRATLDLTQLPKNFPIGWSLVFAAFGLDVALSTTGVDGSFGSQYLYYWGGATILAAVLIAGQWRSRQWRHRVVSADRSNQALELEELERRELRESRGLSTCCFIVASASVAVPVWFIVG